MPHAPSPNLPKFKRGRDLGPSVSGKGKMRHQNVHRESITATVFDRLERTEDATLSKPLLSVVDHLHAIIRETRPSRNEWRSVIGFLTDVGHTSDDQRQEWVLLSDILGISALVEDINSERPQGATRNTIRGPFYRPNAPHYPAGANISLDGNGEPMHVLAKVVDLAGAPIENAFIETWQANSEGRYENQEPDLQPDFNLRGTFRTDNHGHFDYMTVKPAGYQIPDDGPVGQLLNAIGCSLRRPAHLQFRISAPGHQTLTTHVYDGEDPALNEDVVFSVKDDLVGMFCKTANRNGEELWQLKFTFAMVPIAQLVRGR